ncbi:hypothetical protein [Nitrosarchaeum sp. AC2]|uniref:hypothetical protein n=1 Tax=Nitrosarchaeum sp. AC2 TaxID=2259673 RepID=UPI0015CC8649|nr:hypothetical protein [Nitrosarchaeum sp. AC2]QLH10979.1 hypothetical protein DSQ20_05470 [Nitrosarchaeum sp. AC2]
MNFENDLEALQTAIFETEQRIKKLEKHKESVTKELEESNSDALAETLRRLERNLDDLHKKLVFLISERDSKNKDMI